jgi:hypothetical protein
MTDATSKLVAAVTDSVRKILDEKDVANSIRQNEILAAIAKLEVQVSALVAEKEGKKKPVKAAGESKPAQPKGTSSVPTFLAWFQKEYATSKEKYAALVADPDVAKVVAEVTGSAPYKKAKTDATRDSHVARGIYTHCTTKTAPAAWTPVAEAYEAVKNTPVAAPEPVTPV